MWQRDAQSAFNEQNGFTQQSEIRVSVASDHPRPLPDLIKGTRKEYNQTAIPLYEASIRGDWESAKKFLDKRRDLVRYSITENGDTALHVAASAKSSKQVEEFMENLMTYMEKEDLLLQNYGDSTALWTVAASGNLKMVKLMVERNRDLVIIPGSRGAMPLFAAALFGNYDVVKYLYECSHKLRDDGWTNESRGSLLLKCVEANMFDIAVDIVKEHPELGSGILGVLARKTDAFSETKTNIIMRAINWVIWGVPEKETEALHLLKIIRQNIAKKTKKEIDDILRGPRDDNNIDQSDTSASDYKDDQTLQLQDLISDNLVKMQAATAWKSPHISSTNIAGGKYSSRIMFVAAEMGNTKFVVELIRQYPDLIWKVDDNGQSIFHVAVKHRHEGIYNLLHEIGSKKDLVIPLIDNNGNHMLHLVGKSAKKKRLDNVSGAAFQMQRELLWFKEVEEMIPIYYGERKNGEDLTAYELFTMEHKDLVIKGEEWMKGTASQCMVVATLIATIVFAAAFTVPGGYDQNDGIPFFSRKVPFLIFVVADAISLFSSSAAILTFLSILTSRFAEHDFLESLPKKLMLGLSTLFLSITTMMVTFSVSFFVLYHKDLNWIPILITLFATMPVLLFTMLQYPLLRDVFLSTYRSRSLFRPNTQVLYYENSKSNHRYFPFLMPFISRCTSKKLSQ